jgi:hypothetical protein
VLASPVTLAPLRDGIRLYGSAGAVKFKEDTGGQLRFPVNSVYTDLFLGETKAPWKLSREELVMEGTFQSPLTSWLYERGWRQAFVSNGFPGIDKVTHCDVRLVTNYSDAVLTITVHYVHAGSLA